MIRSFRDKALERFFATGDGRRLSVQNTRRIANILRALDDASRPEDMNLPGFRFHALVGRDKGRYAVNAATHFPDRVKAAASIYGTHLATDQPDSPHLAASKTKAELYFGCAETDIYAPQEIIDKVKQAMQETRNEVEIYPGTHHGFAFPKRPVYDRDAAERHWERLLALYRRNLSA